MKKSTILFIVLLSLITASCSSDELESTKDEPKEMSELLKDISVVKLSDYETNMTKYLHVDVEEQYLLKFTDETAYNRTVKALKGLSREGQIDFFDDLNYKSANYQLMSADDELDKIFDIEDDNIFLKEYNNFKEKHENSFVFNIEDKYDLSPYLTFADQDLELVGNIDGRVVVGNKVVAPKQLKPVYHIFYDESDFTQITADLYMKEENLSMKTKSGPMPYEPTFYSYKNATMMIKQGKYQSTMTLGRLPDIESGRLIVRYASQKKKKFWKRRHETTYQGKVQINNGGIIPFICGLKKKVVFVESGVFRPNGSFKARMFDFTSGCCDNQKGDITINCFTN